MTKESGFEGCEKAKLYYRRTGVKRRCMFLCQVCPRRRTYRSLIGSKVRRRV
ncbi:protein of unknown function [[Clostridium] ultunense Esp]|uniref:Uncharacterized protein n=1 Tax=[Clostridium] ultunense Esp TaxID=1288971 RepID=A0A1M4PT76_9FIRM|nr:protein of unknown function [[Clostridium] ultunense Esp]